LLSQLWRSRRKVILLYLAFQTLCVLVLFFQGPMSLEHFYFMCLMIGISTGFWALFVTVASEQFGTNLRSTVTSTVPNFVRGAVIPITLSYVALRGPWGETAAVLITGGVCIGLSLIATLHVRETFEDDMDFLEG
ncbi:MAG TPA: MFS transporter, partial [Flavobacteriales bacterium]|nr:MFS transporter [Flavobacteriales bacterium]